VADLRNLIYIFEEFDPDYWDSAARWARTWLRRMINEATNAFRTARNNGLNPPNAARVFYELRLIERQLRDILGLPPI